MKQTGKNTYNSNMVGTKKRWAVGGQNEIENHRTLEFTGFL